MGKKRIKNKGRRVRKSFKERRWEKREKHGENTSTSLKSSFKSAERGKKNNKLQQQTTYAYVVTFIRSLESTRYMVIKKKRVEVASVLVPQPR